MIRTTHVQCGAYNEYIPPLEMDTDHVNTRRVGRKSIERMLRARSSSLERLDFESIFLIFGECSPSVWMHTLGSDGSSSLRHLSIRSRVHANHNVGWSIAMSCHIVSRTYVFDPSNEIVSSGLSMPFRLVVPFSLSSISFFRSVRDRRRG